LALVIDSRTFVVFVIFVRFVVASDGRPPLDAARDQTANGPPALRAPTRPSPRRGPPGQQPLERRIVEPQPAIAEALADPA